MSCGKRVKNVRETLDLTQAEFGERLGFKWSKVKDIEIGKQKLTPEIALDIEKKFSVDFKWLLTGEGKMKSLPVMVAEEEPSILAQAIVDTVRVMQTLDEHDQKEVLKYAKERKALEGIKLF